MKKGSNTADPTPISTDIGAITTESDVTSPNAIREATPQNSINYDMEFPALPRGPRLSMRIPRFTIRNPTANSFAALASPTLPATLPGDVVPVPVSQTMSTSHASDHTDTAPAPDVVQANSAKESSPALSINTSLIGPARSTPRLSTPPSATINDANPTSTTNAVEPASVLTENTAAAVPIPAAIPVAQPPIAPAAVPAAAPAAAPIIAPVAIHAIAAAPAVVPNAAPAAAPAIVPVVVPVAGIQPMAVPVNPGIQFMSLPNSTTRIHGVNRQSLEGDIPSSHWTLWDNLGGEKIIIILYDGPTGKSLLHLPQQITNVITALTGRTVTISIAKADSPIFLAHSLDVTAANHLINHHLISTSSVTFAALPYNLPFTSFAFSLNDMPLMDTTENAISLRESVIRTLRDNPEIAKFIHDYRDALPNNLTSDQAYNSTLNSTRVAYVHLINAMPRWNIFIDPPTQHPHWYFVWTTLFPKTVIHPIGASQSSEEYEVPSMSLD